MKKSIIISSIILLITLIISETLMLYHFETKPTIFTFSYLISIFSIIEYILITFIYISSKIKNKIKIPIFSLIAILLIFIALLLILMLIIVLNIDWLNWYMNSAPFYINVLTKCLKYLTPAILMIVVSIVILRKKHL